MRGKPFLRRAEISALGETQLFRTTPAVFIRMLRI